MIEENAGAAEHVVGLPVFLDDPVAVLLCHRIGAEGMEGGLLVLGNLLHLAIELRGGCLIHSACFFNSRDPYCLKNPQHAGGNHISRILGNIKGNLDMGLSRQVIHLVRLHLGHDLNQGHRVRQISIHQMEPGQPFQVGDPLPKIHGGSSDHSVDLIPFFQQKFRQKRPILAGYAGDQRFFPHCDSSFCLIS